jgi:hypothetical protein
MRKDNQTCGLNYELVAMQKVGQSAILLLRNSSKKPFSVILLAITFKR